MGIEDSRFAAGTLAIAHALADSTATTVVGAASRSGCRTPAGRPAQPRVDHGGASLEFIEGKVLPGVAALRSDC
jgi:phosphoglycerate kinase